MRDKSSNIARLPELAGKAPNGAGPQFGQSLSAQFEGDYRLEFNLAPPWLSRPDGRTGDTGKRTFGPWILTLFKVLQKFRWLRGTVLDPFGGSGTTFAVCESRGRRWIGIEIDSTAVIVERLERGELSHHKNDDVVDV